MRILALDTGTKTGWALYHPNWPAPESGVQEFKSSRGESPAMRFLSFSAWLTKLIETQKPDILVYEKAHHRGGAATEFCVGLVTHAQAVAAKAQIDYMGVHSGALKKHATGNGKASKQDMIKATKERWGIDVKSHDESDALCLLSYTLDQYGVR